jgi:hypothetical protein
VHDTELRELPSVSVVAAGRATLSTDQLP